MLERSAELSVIIHTMKNQYTKSVMDKSVYVFHAFLAERT